MYSNPFPIPNWQDSINRSSCIPKEIFRDFPIYRHTYYWLNKKNIVFFHIRHCHIEQLGTLCGIMCVGSLTLNEPEPFIKLEVTTKRFLIGCNHTCKPHRLSLESWYKVILNIGVKVIAIAKYFTKIYLSLFKADTFAHQFMSKRWNIALRFYWEGVCSQ